MTRLLEILISLAIVAVLFVIVGIALPSHRTLVESTETNRHRVIVFDTINSTRRFKDWAPAAIYDPGVRLTRSGPDAGVGSRIEFDSDSSNIGKGAWEIIESVPGERVVYSIDDQRRGNDKKTSYDLAISGRGGRNIQITQTYDIDYGWDLIGRYAGLYIKRNVGDRMKLSLAALSNILASVPNADYAVEGSTLTDLRVESRPAEHLLVVNAGAVERNNQEIQNSMNSNLEWIRRAIAANNLEATGPLRIITSEMGRETYTFDVVLPVVRTENHPESGELTDLNLPDVVNYTYVEPTQVATAHYEGFMPELEAARNAVRAWAATQGHTITGRPYEIYLESVETSFTPEGKYQIFWTLAE